MTDLPSHARVVIIGGGVVGCSVAYHLTRLGWSDVVLLERKQLTSGTTWHAAGLIAQLRATANMTRLAKYSQELYGQLEEETGIATGFRRNGSMTVALTEARREEILRQAAMARAFGVEVEEIGPEEIAGHYPHINLDGVVGGVSGSSLSAPVAAVAPDALGLPLEAPFAAFFDFEAELLEAAVDDEVPDADAFDCFPACCSCCCCCCCCRRRRG